MKKTLFTILALFSFFFLLACNSNTASSKATYSLSTSNISEISPNQESTLTYIGIDKAKELALTHANISNENVTFTKEVLEYDDNIMIYDIEFFTINNEYDYSINALTGEIIETEIKSNQTASIIASDNNLYLSIDEVKIIILNYLNLTESDVYFGEVKLEFELYKYIYEIELLTFNCEYEYEIDGLDGTIIDVDKERR